MGDLTEITQAQLNSALTARDESLQRSLSKEDSSILLTLLDGLMRRYPSQDQAETVEEFFRDYEKLALKYSLPKVIAAIEEIRIDPEYKFFPKPDEVAERILVMMERSYRRSQTRSCNAWGQWLEEQREASEAFKVGWRASGLSIADYCAKLDKDDANVTA